jgi:hypothetical protein
MIRRFLLVWGVCAGLPGVSGRPAVGQGLPDSVVAQLHRGASGLALDAGGTSVPLLGTPTLPLVRVVLGGGETARFLIDLGGAADG